MASTIESVEHWRADIIRDFRLRGEERCAAASPGPGYPALLHTIEHALSLSPDGTWLDVASGLGGVASWLTRRTGHDIITLDVSTCAVAAAKSLFGDLDLGAADAAALPVADGSCAAILASGFVSLVDDRATLDSMLEEVRRVLMPDGVLAVADLWSSSPDSVRTDRNRFWSIEDFRGAACAVGLSLLDVGLCETSTGWWPGAADQVDDELARRYGSSEAYRLYRADQEYLAEMMATDQLHAGVVTFRRGGHTVPGTD